MKRRDFITLSAAAAIVPIPATAQQTKPMPVVGILAVASSQNAGAQRALAGFREALAETGFVDGKNVAFEYRWAETQFDRLPALAAELVERKVDVIACEGGEGSALAAKQATSTIPILCILNRDPVPAGLVASLQRPGGNVTGVTLHGLDAKRFEVVTELLPTAKAVAVLVNPKDPSASEAVTETQRAAQAKGVQLQVVEASKEVDIEPAFAKVKQNRGEAILLFGNSLFSGRATKIASLAEQNRMPVIYPGRFYVDNGGLFAYGPDVPAAYRMNGTYVGRILKGEKPADLPIQQPTKLVLSINMKAAKALGLEVPQSLLAASRCGA
jgi:putative ABC transport system substrate-binding protein